MNARPADAGATVYLLTVRGTFAPANLDSARALHNETAGADEGVAAARALGDLSHNVYVPTDDDPGDKRGLLFVDTWNSAAGIGEFFGNAKVAEMAKLLFAERDAVVWAPAEGFGDFHLPTPSGAGVAGVGILRVQVSSIEAAQKAFGAHAARVINDARVAGQISHQTYVRHVRPGEPEAAEVLSIDTWSDAEGMTRFYADESNYTELAGVFAGPPDTGKWRPAPGQWKEW